jgi:Zn-dependent M16 (insulinase) family peptidase
MADHGFELLRESKIAEIDSTARFYRHLRTGAELLSLVNADENKVFGIAFRTPPCDSTGVAHILEHSVLCGSRKYLVKDPLMQLSKGSLATFLNAFTYPDMTCYPVASQNLRDFYNLIDVYIDAVFNPLISPDTFHQEGWHYEIDAEGALTYKGVVFNEMKGSYSSPNNVLGRFLRSSLYPNTPYGLDSGGDPNQIPALTYDRLKAFHEAYYTPNNARLYFYGDDPPTERLAWLDERLRTLEPNKVDSNVPLQPRFDAPRRGTQVYAVGKEDASNKAMVSVNWMLDEVIDAELAYGLMLLSTILSGTAASPLQKTLIDSKLGEAYIGGLELQLRQPYYAVGLKNVDPANADKLEGLILETLSALVENGIDKMAIEAALNITEFHLREYNTGSFPRGISMMLAALRSWLHNGDCMEGLAFGKPLAAIRARLQAGERYFENLIRDHLLHNLHRTTVLIEPDAKLAEREANEERTRLATIQGAMTSAELEAIAAAAQRLKRLQATPDSPEALAAIPALTLADLPKRRRSIPVTEQRSDNATILFHELPTNQVIYLDIVFDLHRLSGELLPYVPLFCEAILQTGVGEQDFVMLWQRIQRSTGGISAGPWMSATRTPGKTTAGLFLYAKTMPNKSADLFGILEDVLTAARLQNRERVRQLVLKSKSVLEHAVVPYGSDYAGLRLRAQLHEAHWAAEKVSGIDYLFFLRKLAEDVDTNWEEVLDALEQVRSVLIDRTAMLCNVTTDASNWRLFEPRLRAFIANLPISRIASESWQMDSRPSMEGLLVPAKINFVAKGGDIRNTGYQTNGATAVVIQHLNHTWLHEKVRVEGGAYGVSCYCDRPSGAFVFTSYRDPNVQGTLDVFDGSAEFLQYSLPDDADLARNIIGVIGGLDQYELPDAKGRRSLAHWLKGDTDEHLQRFREEVFSTTTSDFRRLAEALAELGRQGHVVVMGSEEALREAYAARQDKLQLLKVI